jgi:hypothetical protein
MRGDEVIIVDAVLDQQLPVRLDVVFLRAGDDLHAAGRRLIDHEIDVILGAREIVLQIDRAGDRDWQSRNPCSASSRATGVRPLPCLS